LLLIKREQCITTGTVQHDQVVGKIQTPLED